MKTIKLDKNTGVFIVPFLLILITVLIVKSTQFRNNANLLSFGVTFDLLFSIPLIYYLLIRKTRFSNKSVSVILTINLIIASYLLPVKNQHYLTVFKLWVLPIFEIFIIGLLIFNVRKIINKTKNSTEVHTNFFSILKKIISGIAPKIIVIPFATEIAIFYYGFINWKKRPLKINEFSYHKNSGIITLLIAFMMSGAIEIYVLHTLIIKWNQTFAWVLTGLSAYTIIQIFGMLRSLPKIPILITKKGIFLRYGILSETFIDFDNIYNIEIFTKDIEKSKTLKYLSPFRKLEGHNVKISLKNEVVLNGLYGIKQNFTVIAFNVDNKKEFVHKIKKIISE